MTYHDEIKWSSRKMPSDPLALHHVDSTLIFAGLRNGSAHLVDLRTPRATPDYIVRSLAGKAIVNVKRLDDATVPWGLAVSAMNDEVSSNFAPHCGCVRELSCPERTDQVHMPRAKTKLMPRCSYSTSAILLYLSTFSKDTTTRPTPTSAGHSPLLTGSYSQRPFSPTLEPGRDRDTTIPSTRGTYEPARRSIRPGRNLFRSRKRPQGYLDITLAPLSCSTKSFRIAYGPLR